MRVLSAVGAEFERDFAFGLVRQLFEAELRAAAPERRERLLAGPAQFASAVLDGADEPARSDDVCHVRLHGARLAGRQPGRGAAAGDRGRRRPLGRRRQPARARHARAPARGAADRADRGRAPGRAAAARARSRGRPCSTRSRSARTPSAACSGGELDAPFVAAAAETTGGNPLLVRELRPHARRRRPRRAAPRRPRPCGAPSPGRSRGWSGCGWPSSRSKRVRWPAPRPSAPPARAALAGLDEASVARAHAALADANLLERDALRFTHPMMREAALAGVVAAERSALHRRAAALLAQAGASEDVIAAHYLAAEPAQDPHAARVLTSAGTRALGDGRRRRRARPAAPRGRGGARVAGAAARARPRRGAARRCRQAEERLAAASAATDPRIAARAAQALRPHARPLRPLAPRGRRVLDDGDRARAAGSPPSSRTTCSTR